MEQGSVEWLLARVGMITASRIIDVMPTDAALKSRAAKEEAIAACAKAISEATEKTRPAAQAKLDKAIEAYEAVFCAESAARAGYRVELAVERISGLPKDGYVSGPMKWGIENEPFAKAAYSIATGLEVEEAGFIAHPGISRAGASPDGLVGIHGGVEVKCPNTATHIDWAIAGKVPPEHRLQMQFCMDCTERDWWDFVSYDPRMPEAQQLFVRRLYRDESIIKSIREEVAKLDGDVESTVADLLKVVWIETNDKD